MKRLSLFYIFVSVVLYYIAPNYPSRPFMGLCVTMALVLMFLHTKGCGAEDKLKRIYLRHSIVFILGYLIVFFQRAIDYSVGLIDEYSGSVESLLWANVPFVVSKACALSLIGISAFVYGYNSYTYNKNIVSKVRYQFRLKKGLVLSGFLLLLVYVILTGIGDFTKKEESENIGYLMVAQAVLLAVVVIYTYDYKYNAAYQEFNKRFFIVPVSLIAFYLFIYFATGNRGGAIKVCFMLLVAYLYLQHEKVNYKKIFFCFLIGALAMTTIGIVRTMETKDMNEVAALMSVKETVSPFTVELSGSVNTVHVALANYPSKKKFNCGTSFFSGFSVLVPGLSRITHGMSENSGDILTKMYFGGSVPDWGWGLGSSAVADVYISFGMIGVLLIFFLFGKFLHYLEYGTFVIEKSPFFLVLSFCVYSQFISLCRGPFSILFLSWDYALIIVLVCAIKRMKRI